MVKNGYDIEQTKAACPPEAKEGDRNTSGQYDSVGKGKASSPCGSTDPDHDEGSCEDCCYYSSSIPNTVTVGGLNQGDTYNNVHIHQMWFDLTHPYLYPEPHLEIFPKIVEVGAQVGIVNFTWTSSQIENVKENTGTILVDGWNNYHYWQIVLSGQAIPGAKTHGFSPNLVRTDYGSIDFMFDEQNTKGGYVNTIEKMWWYWPIYFGVSQEEHITAPQILNLTKQLESPNWKPGDWFHQGPGYKYFAIPDVYDTPVTIKEKETGFGLAVAADEEGYTEGGSEYYNYKFIWITNIYGVTARYRLYRSTNYLNDDKTFLIT